MKVKFLILILLAFLINLDVDAQCSMCRFAAESSYASGSDIGKGLNNGIVYMMGIPYILLIGVGVLLFKKLRKDQAFS